MTGSSPALLLDREWNEETRERDGSRVFELLYRRFSRLVHGILLASVRPQDVEDLVQEVFLRVHRYLDSLRRPECAGGWIARIARNVAAEHGRRRRQETRADFAEFEADSRHPRVCEATDILRVLQALPPAYSETLTLRLVEGMSAAQIASATGRTQGSVRVNLHRGMKKLRARLNTEGWS